MYDYFFVIFFSVLFGGWWLGFLSGRGRLIMPLIAFDSELLGKFPGNFDVKLSSVIHSCLLRLVMLRHVKQFSTY